MEKCVVYTVLQALLLVSIADTTRPSKKSRASETRSPPSRQDVRHRLSRQTLAQNSITTTGRSSNSNTQDKHDIFRKIFTDLEKISVDLEFSNPSDHDASSENLVKLYDIAKASSNKKPTRLFIRLMKKYDKDEEKPSKRYYKKRKKFFNAVAKTETYRIVSEALATYDAKYKDKRTLRKHMDIAWAHEKGRRGGFEHTFFGVMHPGDRLLGMHNWLRIAHLIVAKDRVHHGELIRAVWPRAFATSHSHRSPEHSAFLGYVPEFDVLIYTALHLVVGGGKHRIRYKDVVMKFLIATDSKRSPIKSAYPEFFQ